MSNVIASEGSCSLDLRDFERLHIDIGVEYNSASAVEEPDPSSSSHVSNIPGTRESRRSLPQNFTPPAELYREFMAETVAEPRYSRASRSHVASYLEDSEQNGTANQYVPLPVHRPARRRGATGTMRTQGRVRAAPYPSTSTTSSPDTPAPHSFSRRNATAWTQPNNDNALQHSHWSRYQKNGRRVDLLRHIETHFGSKRWVCCGLPCADDQMEIMHHGVPHAGGCRGSFSRSDSLKRHIRTAGCTTDLDNLSHYLVFVV